MCVCSCLCRCIHVLEYVEDTGHCLVEFTLFLQTRFPLVWRPPSRLGWPASKLGESTCLYNRDGFAGMCRHSWLCGGGVKRPSPPLELELQVAVSHSTWVLGKNSDPLQKEQAQRPISPAPYTWPFYGRSEAQVQVLTHLSQALC